MAVNESFGAIPADRSVVRATAAQWEDLANPAHAINTPGAATDPVKGLTTGMLEFSGTVDNILPGASQLPHAWEEGSSVVPHLHLRFFNAAAGVNTRWKLEVDVASPNTDFANAYGTYTLHETITVTNPNNAGTHIKAEFSALAMTGKLLSTIIAWRLTRLKTDVLDTDTGVCALLSLDFHFQSDSIGSTTGITK